MDFMFEFMELFFGGWKFSAETDSNDGGTCSVGTAPIGVGTAPIGRS